MNEQALQSKILEFLNSRQETYAIKHNVIGAYSRAGEPDIIGSCCGLSIVVEVKTDTGVLSKLQEKKLALWEAAGTMTFIVTPSNFENFKQKIKNKIEDKMITRAIENMKYNALKSD